MADLEALGWDMRRTYEWIIDNHVEGDSGPTEPDNNNQGFEFISIAELVKKPISTAWMVKPIVTKKCLFCIFADPAGLKTFLAIDLGISVASGKNFLNTYDVLTTGPVFYIAGEGFNGIPARLRAVLLDNKLNPASIPFYMSKRAAGFLDKRSAESVHEAVEQLSEQHGNPVLIIVDTVSRNFGPGDENFTSDMSAFVTAMDDLKDKFDCAVLLVHHSGLADKGRGRGSSVLRAALDFEYKIARVQQGSDIRKVTCTKAKDTEPPASFSFMPREVFLEWQDPETGEDLYSIVLDVTDTPQTAGPKLTGARRVALDVLSTLDTDDAVHIDVWREAAYEAGISASSDQSAKQKAFKRAVSGLLDMQLIECKGDYYKRIEFYKTI